MPEIIAAVGPGPEATTALRWAAMLTRRTGDDLVAVTVFDRPYSEMDPGKHEGLVERRMEQIDTAVGDVDATPAKIEVLEGEPHATLLDRITRSGAEYVVVGQHSSGEFGGESTAHYLIHHIHRPVAVIRDEAELTRGPVVVGVDGSSTNARALERAAHLSRQLGSELVAVFCPDPPADGDSSPEVNSKHAQEVRGELGELLDPDVTLLIEPGHPTETLARIADERDATALVVGTRGRGGFHGLIAGRVATQLLRHSPVPLVIVPHANP